MARAWLDPGSAAPAQALADPIAKGLGDIGGTGHAQQGEGEVAPAGHHLATGCFADLGAVFIKGDMPNPVVAIFNRPMIPVQREQAGRASFLRSETGQAINGFAAEFPGDDLGDVGLEAEHLGRIREGERAGRLGDARWHSTGEAATGRGRGPRAAFWHRR